MTVPLKSAIINPTKQHKSTVVFLHGLGDSGHGWLPVGQMLSPLFPHSKFIFPHAPNRPVTLNFGSSMPAWYDIYSLDKSVKRQDEQGLNQSAEAIQQLIKAELDSGIPSDKIILGGFSQGAAMSLLIALKTSYKLGGIICLSGYLPLGEKIQEFKTTANDQTKIFMGHGLEDEVVAFQWGKESFEKLKALGLDVELKTYSNLGHSANDKEIADVAAFLTARL